MAGNDAGILDANLRVLERSAGTVAATLRGIATDAALQTLTSPQGPVLQVAGLAQENPQEPLRTAAAWARAQVADPPSSGAAPRIVLGCGSAFHLEALVQRCAGQLHLLEPRPGVLRGLLASRDLRGLLDRLAGVHVNAESIPQEVLARAELHVHEPSRASGGAEFARTWTALQARRLESHGALRICVVGPRYGGSLGIARHASEALRALGHEVSFADFSPFQSSWAELGRFVSDPARRRPLEDAHTDLLGAALVESLRADPPDLVLALAQAPLDVAALRAIGELGVARALWFVEDFRVFDYWQRVAPYYDHVFVIQQQAVAAMQRAGCPQATYLPSACAPAVHRPLRLSAQEQALYGADVSFVGAGYPNRRASLPAFGDLDLRVWGSDWEGASGLERVLQRAGARIGEEECVRIFRATKVNLNLHSSSWCRGVDPRGDFLNPRTFELAACGSFQIVDERSHLTEHFVAGSEVCAVPDIASMKEATLHYLAHPEERAEIAAAGRRRALREHSYEQRMAQALRDLAGSLRLAPAHAREGSVGALAHEAPEPLASWLASLDPEAPLSLDGLAAEIAAGEGDLSEAEGVVLFLQQFRDLYLGEAAP